MKNSVSDSHIGKRIVALRDARGWSQGQLASALRSEGLPWSQGTLSKVETGQRPIRLSEVPKLVAVLGATISDLLGAKAFRATNPPGRVAELEAELHDLRNRLRAIADIAVVDTFTLVDGQN